MIKINGEVWRVFLVSPSHPLLVTPEGTLALGVCDDIARGIYISNALPRKQIRKVLCHELVHAAMYSYNVDISDETEEIVADLIATYGDEIIRLTNLVYNKYKNK